ncbi:myosin-15 [Acomys russatus]|uniref:myosin-15 n=1 Tax=Acomys russatus TaxID=60746 RepID=UPI0021E1EE7B|nr:myosin-15 [Acomys russatus]
MMDLSEFGDAAAFLRRKKSDPLLQSSAFDGKKKCWVHHGKNAYIEAEVKESDGDGKVIVETRDAKSLRIQEDKIQQMNPAQFEMTEDLSMLFYLNEASVLHTLRRRYDNWMIYTYAGLFCVAINPYKWLPVYQKEVMAAYKGKRRSEAPPHIFAVANCAFQDMLRNGENQSILFTGESGAGKTVNTKLTIQYFATMAAISEPKKKLRILDDQVVQMNPILEAFGNAKTLRNDNSSRFGKLIRMHFGARGTLSSADIQIYFLEKSRVVYQQPEERNFHIFYQILSGKQELQEMLLVSTDASDFHICSCGVVAVESLDDAEQFLATEKAIDIMGFPPHEKFGCYKLVGAIMHFGNLKFRQNPREEQLEADGTENADKAAFLMGIKSSELVNGLIYPRIKIGNEYVTRSQNVQQVTHAVGALSKSIYERMFKWLVARMNQVLGTKLSTHFFIAVLDITGFEILEYNSLEQLCINFTNEKLQQFFNQHMFILEQEEYKKEGLDWVSIDYSLDLQACVDLTEKPMGIFSILEEECMFPTATDKTFKTKLFENHFGKSAYFQKPTSAEKENFEVHFELAHYAGVVPYNISGWLGKNKDLLNETVVTLLQKSSNKVLANLFSNDVFAGTATQFGEKTHKKGTSSQLITSRHKDNINKLMTDLKSTAPHFVRCISPNTNKMPGVLDPFLVLQQLRCNGVLEGIRVCSEGFPTRMLYDHFKQRYCILNPRIFSKNKFVSSRKATEEVLEFLEIDHSQYHCGVTKVFFKASILDRLEERRDEKISEIFTLFQARARGKLMRITFQKILEEREALVLIQENIRAFMAVKNWPWMGLFFKIKPLAKCVGLEEEINGLKEECAQLQKALENSESQREELKTKQVSLVQENNDLLLQLQAKQETLVNAEEQCESLIKSKMQLEAKVKELSGRVEEEEEINSEVTARGRKLEDECSELKKEIYDLETILAKSEKGKCAAEHKARNLDDEVHSLNEEVIKLTRAVQAAQKAQEQTLEHLHTEEDKVSNMSKANQKLGQQVDALEGDLEQERKARMKCEKEKRKLQGELKMNQEGAENLESSRQQLAEQLRKKELEMGQVNSKVENEKNRVSQLQKMVKELQTHILKLKEELENERTTRAKVERERADLTQDLEDLSKRLEEAGGTSLTQMAITKQQEARFQKLRHDMEETTRHFEATSASLKKRHAESLAELESQVEHLQHARQVLEQDKRDLQLQVDNLLTRVDQMARAKANTEKLCDLYERRLNAANTKLDEVTQLANDLTTQKTKLQSESSDSLKRLEEKEALISQLSREKSNLTRQIEELRGQLEEETRSQDALAHALQSAKHDCDLLREQYEEEQEVKTELHRALSKGSKETAQWRTKYEHDAIQRTEDVEEAKKKLAIRLQEAAEAMEVSNGRNASLERARHRLQLELGDALSDLGKARSVAAALEQKRQHTDKTLAAWKQKQEEAQELLQASQKEARALSTEALRLKQACEESTEAQETLRRQNQDLQEQICNLTNQVREGIKNLAEMEKAKKLIEQEKIEAQVRLEEAEGALERNESKLLHVQLELLEAKAELEKKLSEKEEEAETLREKHQQAMGSLQSSLDSEALSRIEATRLRKKMEGDLKETELQLCAANRQVSQTTRAFGQLRDQMKDLQQQLDDSVFQNKDLKEHVALAEQHNTLLQSEVEELRSLQEQTERGRKLAEKELLEATEQINLFHTQNTSLLSQKKKLEADVAQIQKEAGEMLQACQKAEEKAKRAAAEAANMSEELKKEQDTNAHLERIRKNMEQTIKDLQKRLGEAEQTAVLGNKKQIQKLESRVRDLEAELEGELRRSADAQREARRLERGIKELTYQAEEDKKHLSRMQALSDKLQLKVQSYKQQVEAAEAQANQYLSKYKKQQYELNEAKEKAEAAESQVNKLKAKVKELEKKFLPHECGGLQNPEAVESNMGAGDQIPVLLNSSECS